MGTNERQIVLKLVLKLNLLRVTAIGQVLLETHAGQEATFPCPHFLVKDGISCLHQYNIGS